MIDPITKYILENKIINEIGFRNRNRPPARNALYDGFDISVDEYTAFIGGKGNFQKVIKKLQEIIKKQIKRYDDGMIFREFEYADTANVGWSGKAGEITISYSIWAVDTTEHMMSAAHSISFKNGKHNFEVTSGWDG